MAEESPDIRALKTVLDELKIINNLLNNISRVRETNHVMSIIINELVRVTQADQGVISLVSPAKDGGLTTVIRNQKSKQAALPYKVDSLISGWVLKHRQVLKIDSLEKDDRFGAADRQGRSDKGSDNYNSVVCCPMIVHDEIVGLTTLIRSKDAEPFSDDDCRLAGIIASQSAQILFNARLMEDLALKNELLELSRQKLRDENLRLRQEITSKSVFENIVGKSPAMKNILMLISKFSSHDSPVLILGPTGTGKELVARTIHSNSKRANGPFVVINCGTKTEALLESELFGHVKGAFTGAIKDKIGLFKEAHRGTIFLDEIGDASLATQLAILRVIETGEIRPVGSTKTEIVDVRVISATNRDISEEMKRGRFREDLFYRLSTFTIELPSVAQRKEDIPLLVNHFLGKIRIKAGRENLTVSPEAMGILQNYPWPGNVRQLENEIERAAVVCDPDGRIDVKDLSLAVLTAADGYSNTGGTGRKLNDIVDKFERNIIISTLAEFKGNIMQASKALGLTRKGLRDKMGRYGIERGKGE